MGKGKMLGKGIGYYFLIIILFTVLGVGTSFITGHGQLFMKEYFGVWEQNIETEIYKETEMYNEGKVQELAKAKLEYEQADEDGKELVASMIRQRFADYEAERLPEGLAEFLTKIRGY